MTSEIRHAILRPREIAPRERGGGVRTFPMVNARIGSLGRRDADGDRHRRHHPHR